MKAILLSLTCLLCFACAAPDFNYRPVSTRISEPPLNSTATAYVGDVLLRQGKYSEHDAIYVNQKIRVSLAYDLHPGYYVKKGEDKKTETFYPGGDEPGHVKKALLADPWQAVMTYKGTEKICVVTVFNALSCTKSGNFQPRNLPILSSDSFQQTLIYSGKVGNKINIGYREFSSSLARPAFNNDVEYDLSSSKVIGYKGARLEIIEATNEYIKYKIISNFNEASM